ncbi:MAG: ABC transporter substrate-binding protein, partial [Alphaproteobacteria bacterium]
SSSLTVNAATIEKKPDVVARFTRAFVRGWAYAKANPEEAFALTIKAQPTLDNKYNRLKLPAVLTLLDSPAMQKNGIGHSDRGGWEALQKALVQVDLLKEPVDLDKVYTNKFLPQPKS